MILTFFSNLSVIRAAFIILACHRLSIEAAIKKTGQSLISAPVKSQTVQPIGFTIIDLLVAIGIFAVLVSLTIANFNQGSQRDDLRQSGLLVASILEEAQTYTLSGVTVKVNNISTVPIGGYGVYFDLTANNQIRLFPDLNGNGSFDSDSEVFTDWIYTLPSGVVMQSLLPASPVVLSFRPPLAERYINNVLHGGVLQVVLYHSRIGATTTITANAISGQINVQ